MSKLLINEHPLMVLPTLAVKIGLNESIMLQQIHYWIDPRTCKNLRNNEYWVYNSYAQWQQQFPFWSERTIRRTIKNLEDSGYLKFGYHSKSSFDKTKWYTINYAKLEELTIATNRCGQSGHFDENNLAISTRQLGHIDNDTKDISIGHNDQNACPNWPEEMSKTDNSYIKKQRLSTENIQRHNELDKFLAVYEEIFNPDKNYESITVDKIRENKLHTLLKDLFSYELRQWQQYLEIVQSNKFLMGKVTEFKVHFDWLINITNARKVLEGAYANNHQPSLQNKNFKLSTECESYINNLPNDNLKKIICEIITKIGEGAFISWFKDIKFFYNSKTNSLTVFSKSKFKLQWITQHYDIKIKNSVQDTYPEASVQYEIST